MSSEMLKMRQQLEYLQAELCARGGVSSSDEVQVSEFYELSYQLFVGYKFYIVQFHNLSCKPICLGSQGKDCLA